MAQITLFWVYSIPSVSSHKVLIRQSAFKIFYVVMAFSWALQFTVVSYRLGERSLCPEGTIHAISPGCFAHCIGCQFVKSQVFPKLNLLTRQLVTRKRNFLVYMHLHKIRFRCFHKERYSGVYAGARGCCICLHYLHSFSLNTCYKNVPDSVICGLSLGPCDDRMLPVDHLCRPKTPKLGFNQFELGKLSVRYNLICLDQGDLFLIPKMREERPLTQIINGQNN